MIQVNNLFKKAAVCAAICSSLTFYSATALAGNVDGALKGSITQQSSSTPIAGAAVTISNSQNGYKKTVVVGPNGEFSLASVPVGKYKVEITKAGYQTSVLNDVSIKVGQASSLEVSMTQGDVEVISVTGSRISPVDISSSEASFNISAEELTRLPVAQDITSVAMLSPGVNLGDSEFSDAKGNVLGSFGGASQAENVYYVNGLNMTNFRNGVGGATVPFMSYDSFQIKTGGYSAEFGRSTGGVINSVTKSGTNEFHYGIQHTQNIDSLYGNRPNSYFMQDDCANTVGQDEEGNNEVVTTCSNRTGDIITDNSLDSREFRKTDIFASGALIEDTLFFYGLYEFRNRNNEDLATRGTTLEEFKDDDPFYLGRLDWNINEDHKLMAWYFKDETTSVTNKYTRTNGVVDYNDPKQEYSTTGGDSWSVNYNGYITDNLSISAMVGKVGFTDQSDSPSAACNVIVDAVAGENLGCWGSSRISSDSDERKQYRFDVEWLVFDDHQLRFGFDAERNTSKSNTQYSGDGLYYRYMGFDAGAELSNGAIIPRDDTYVRVIENNTTGSFDVNNEAFYIEDTWFINDQLTATIGFRWDSFENLNADGDTFAKIDNQFAPRLGIAYDLFGDGEHKVFANAGRYFLPVAANTNVRLAGAELYTRAFYEEAGRNADDTPILGAQLGELEYVNNADGSTPSPVSVRDDGLEPMYQDEFIIGYEGMINEDWSFGAKFTRREVKSIIDDGAMTEGFASIGLTGDAANQFLLFNPGNGVSFQYDFNGDGNLQDFSFTAEQLGYPDAERKYNSVDLTLEKNWDGVWMFNATYTWAQSYGNAEGYVKSDNGQDDAGLTTDWDYPYLMDGAYGYLPNDRRHALKLFGSYAVTDNLMVGANANITSGRPRNILGAGYAPDQSKYEYGDTYYVGDDFHPRGSFGRTPWTATFNANIQYDLTDYIPAETSFIKLNVYNLFDASNTTTYEELAEDEAVDNSYAQFGRSVTFQSPRRVEVVFNMTF